MEKKWYSSWDPSIPKFIEPEKSLSAYLADKMIETPDKVAISFYGHDMTYRNLSESIERFAGGLVSLGVKKGDRIAIYMENCPQFIISFLGTLLAGGIVVSLNPMFKHAELVYEINDSGAETLIVMDFLFPEVKKIIDQTKLRNVLITSFTDFLPDEPTLPLHIGMKQQKVTFPGTLDFVNLLCNSLPQKTPKINKLKDDIALLQYTGGTTGLPKGAIISHYALAHSALSSVFWHGYTKDDVYLCVLPFFHSYGMAQCLCGGLVSGGHLVILARFSPEVIAKAITQYRCSVFVATPTMITAMLEWPEMKQYDVSCLLGIFYGGASMPTAIETRLKNMAPRARIGNGYGLTETMAGGGIACPPSRFKPGFVGIPNISTDVKIVDLEKGTEEVSPLEQGEIIIKSRSLMTGYWNNPEETRNSLREGWLYTGDIGKMDDEGWVAVVGRKKELIKCSGYSVFPTEVEELLYRHPAVAEVAVIGVADAYRGESPKAFIVLEPEFRGKISEKEIIEWAKENMAAYKRPRIVEFRDELPKSGAGKILRRILAEEEKNEE